jgi:predicted RND superfamily exporter protein
MTSSFDARALDLAGRLARLQHAHPWRITLAAFALAALALPWLSQLELNSDFQSVLPESAQSVRDLDTLRERVGATATLALAVQATGDAPDREALHAFVRALAPRIAVREDVQIVSVDWNVAELEDFVREHRFLYASHEDLVALERTLRARVEWERAHASPFYLDLDGEPAPDVEGVVQDIRSHAEAAHARMDRFPGGFYEHPTEPLDLLFVRTSIRGGEVGATDRLVAAIEAAASEALGHDALRTRTTGTDVGWVSPGIRIDYGGELMDMSEENDALEEAVARSTLVTIALLMLSIWLFFGRVRAMPLLALVLVPPCAVTFGIAEVVVDYLNASSAFLGSIVVGNGVNSSIMWLGRYFEERRAGRSVERAIAGAHEGTWAGTLAACFACTLAYGSLMVTDYRGFRDFGFIGALGMLLCWASAYLLLPALAAITERARPMQFADAEVRRKGLYGVMFARVALGSPRVVAGVCVALSIVSAGALAVAIQGDALEYDFRNLQAERASESRVTWVNDRMNETVEETRTGGALALLAPRTEDVASLRAQLETYGAEHPGALGAVRTIDDFLPPDQDANLPLLRDLRALVLEVQPHLSAELRARVDENLPPAELARIEAEDLPASIARPFTERDGTRGRIAFVEHAAGEDTWEGHYMIRWAEAVRSARTADGQHPAVGGGAAVFADLLSSIFEDGPVVIGASLLLTVLLLLGTFRAQRERLLALGSMLAGVLWMVGGLAMLGTKLNFLNMVALPITFGIGVEYGVNFVKRFLEEKAETGDGPRAVRSALEGAGGAVILCSFTTLAGYISLYASANRALNSFGLAMSIGEVTCLGASVVALPAVLLLLESRRAMATTAVVAAAHGAQSAGCPARASRWSFWLPSSR